jgi:hypothetical protein
MKFISVNHQVALGSRNRIASVAVLVSIALVSMQLGISPANASTNSVTVQANTPILTSGIVVDGVTNNVIVSATGSWAVGGQYGAAYGPAGSSVTYTEPCALVTTAPMGALVGTLDGGNTWFALGAGLTVITGIGNLGFSANDCAPAPLDFGYWGDNTGSVNVSVTSTLRMPTLSSQCKQGGWKKYGIFENQGDCVSYVVEGSHKKSHDDSDKSDAKVGNSNHASSGE